MTKQEVLNIDTNTALMSINQLKESIKKLKEELGQLKIGSQQYEQKSKELITAQNNLKKANDLTKASMDNFGNSIAGMQVKLTNVRRELYLMSTTDPGFKKKAKEVEQLAAQLNKAKIAAGDFKNNIGNYKSGFGMFGDIMKGGASSLLGFSTAAGAAAAGVALLAKGVSHMIDVNKTFEQENANLRAILNENDQVMQNLALSARILGNNTLYTADEVTKLQIVLAKLGFEAADIKNMQESVLNFAFAVGAELADAAELAGATLRAFNRDSTETNTVLNKLALSTTNSALDFGKLSTAMPIVGSVAYQLGFSLEDTLAILGKLTNAGMDASTAATATRNIMLFLADSNSKLNKTLGTSVSNLDEFAKALEALKDRGVALGEIFEASDKRSVAALSTLVEQSTELTRLRDEIASKEEDAIARMRGIREDTLSSEIEKLKSAWNDLMLSFSNSTGILQSITKWFKDGVNAVREFVDGIYENSERSINENMDKYIAEYAEQWTENYYKMIEAAGGSISDVASTDADAVKRLQDAANKVKDDATNKLNNLQAKLDAVNQDLQSVAGTVDKVDKISATSKLFGTGGKIFANTANILTAKSKERAAALVQEKERLSQLIAEQERYIRGASEIINDNNSVRKQEANKNYSGGPDKSAIANLRARYEALTQYEISELKKRNQNEVDFENEQYAIKQKYFDKILKLYAKNSTEYYHMIVKIEEAEQQHIDKLNKITDAKLQASAEEEILKYTKLNAAMVISDQELADETLKIQKKYIAERKKLYSENSKEYLNLLKEEARLERKREKEHEDYVRKMQKQGEQSYESIKKEIRQLAQFSLSDWTAEDSRYFEELGKLNDNFNKSNGAINLKRLEAIKAIDESEILSAEQKAKMKLDIEEEYLTESNTLYDMYMSAQDLIEKKHAELKARIREEEIVRGAKVAIDVVDMFNESLIEGSLAAFGDGLVNMANNFFDTYSSIGPTIDALDKSLLDIGVSMTTQQKALMKIGTLAGVTFNAMGNMLSGIAAEQDQTSREGFESAKKMNIAAATMSMIGGVVNSLAGIPSYIEMFKPLGIAAPPAGIALGSTLAAMVTAMGIANIAKIASQKFDGSSTTPATNAQAMNSIIAPVSYSHPVEGASTTDEVDQEQYVVHVSEINQVQNRVRVAENEARF